MGLFNIFGGSKFSEGLKVLESTKNAVLLDVRTKEEYKQGHVPGSINIPLDSLPGAKLKKDAPLFIYCQSGARSSRASSYLEGKGFKTTNLGGIISYKGNLER